MSTAPFGTWSSTITAEVITKGANSISDAIVDKITGEVYHLEGRPSEAGRTVLVNTQTGCDVVGAGWNVRTGVHEYGGAPAIVHNKVAYFSHYDDGRVYRVSTEGGDPKPVTPDNVPYRYACLDAHPTHPHLLVSICEDHTIDVPASVVNTLVILDTKHSAVHPFVSGTDFYAQPTFSPDGHRVAWQQWAHPDMPWEGGEIHIAEVHYEHGKLSIRHNKRVAGEPIKVSAAFPAWANNYTLIFTSDISGFINPWKYDVRHHKAEPLFPNPVDLDFGQTMWYLNWFPYAILDEEGRYGLFSALEDGKFALFFGDLRGGSPPQRLDNPFVVIDYVRTVSRKNNEFAFTAQTSTSGKAIMRGTLVAGPGSDVSISLSALKPPDTENPILTPDLISSPEPITLKIGPNDEPLYVVYYPPHNPAYTGSSDPNERPPCLVGVHGGPTGMSAQGLDWSKQYFTTRGFAWLDVNYGGSSGFGRKYIQRLQSNWGIVDVEDCITAAKAVATNPHNLIDLKRVLIRGGSAGGFTTLAALSISTDVGFFAAGTSLYGISNLAKLAEFTHKFESKYMDKLMGGSLDEIPDVYKARSPVFHADKIVSPLLLLQGELDKVVPKEQAQAIYDAMSERGLEVELKLYAGEGHGWRQESTMKDALEREVGWYKKVLKLQ